MSSRAAVWLRVFMIEVLIYDQFGLEDEDGQAGVKMEDEGIVRVDERTLVYILDSGYQGK